MKHYIDIGDRRYLIRGPFTPDQVRERYADFQKKYPASHMSLRDWAAERGAVYCSTPIARNPIPKWRAQG